MPKLINTQNRIETTKSKKNVNKLKFFFLGFGMMFAFFLLLIIIFLTLPDLLINTGRSLGFDSESGSIGDTLGGTMGPVIGLIAAILTFMAFYVQYDANQQQRVDLKRDRFENKFFEMLKLHKENISEMIIVGFDSSIINKTTLDTKSGTQVIEHSEERISKTITGRKIFVSSYNELGSCFKICKETLKNEKGLSIDYLISLSYKLFYYGIGSTVVTQIDDSIPGDKDFVKSCKVELKKARKDHESSHGKNNIFQTNGGKMINMFFKYRAFSGHSSRFDHYYRHLFTLVNFVVKQDKEIMEYPEKREYLKMVRAQLSSQEQVMLYFNYLSGEGCVWEDENCKFFSDYRMIHNLSHTLSSVFIDPRIEFSEQIERIRLTGEEMFDFDEPKRSRV